ncbi:hypothetical protein LJK88_10335 [Paenibacillus sp. P26]|nr:hypothetical protein LJK88_10335 [Paenibacillus sp. P26]
MGESICRTRSIVPTSMPSSSDAVATRRRSSPAFSARSTSRRCSRATSAVMGAGHLIARSLIQMQRQPFA